MPGGRPTPIAVVCLALFATACSTTTEIGGAATTRVTAPSTSGQVLPGSPEACALSHDSLEVAADAYMAIHGTYPESAQAMVDAGLLMSAPDTAWSYSYTPGDRDYLISAVAGGACD